MNKILIKNASMIATPMGNEAQRGSMMNHISLTENGSLIIADGIIEALGPADEISEQYGEAGLEVIDATGKCIIPGFVDSHTHFLFGGYREDEFLLRLQGATYMEIMNAKGGIANTVVKTRGMTASEMYELGRARLDEMLAFGITTVEGKSGYGLDLSTEIRQLEVMHQLNQNHPIDVVCTYMGAHAIPPEYERKEDNYIDYIMETVLPYVAVNRLAEYCDIFCEENVFSVERSSKLLKKAQELGMGLKIHADEITSLGGAEMAAEVKASSADHLLCASPEGISALAKSDVVATLLPCTAFCLDQDFANARKMIQAGCAVALASDYNPGSCFSNSIPLLVALACIKMKMSPEEILTALTLNGAAAIGRADMAGSLEKGKKADLLILKYPSYKFLVYNTGVNIVEKVIKNGRLVRTNH